SASACCSAPARLSLYEKATSAPSAARASTSARPRPRPPPVTAAIFPRSLGSPMQRTGTSQNRGIIAAKQVPEVHLLGVRLRARLCGIMLRAAGGARRVVEHEP